MSDKARIEDVPPTDSLSAPGLALRSAVGGVLMGLANLVPGISGGTMLVATGIYRRFIDAIAEVTTLKFRSRSLLVLGLVVVAAGAAILLLAGPVKTLVVDHRWVMYSLFIGLTLGGVPIVWRMINRPGASVGIAAVCGFAGMAALAMAQSYSSGGGATSEGLIAMFAAGALAASAMILPGVSGGYLLLVLGAYVPILQAVDALKTGLRSGDFGSVTEPASQVVAPVGVGVIVGIVLVSNVLRWLLHRFPRPTLGVLLGLLFGAVVGLWPFQRGVEPEPGSMYKGRVVTRELLRELSPDDWPTEFFTPAWWQLPASLGLILAGFAVTLLISRLGAERKKRSPRGSSPETQQTDRAEA
jgi:putative membrane protein